MHTAYNVNSSVCVKKNNKRKKKKHTAYSRESSLSPNVKMAMTRKSASKEARPVSRCEKANLSSAVRSSPPRRCSELRRAVVG